MSPLFLRVVVTCLVLQRSNAYNLNTKYPTIFSDQKPSGRSSYFGYSVALYKGSDTSVILVGAPRANSSRPEDVRDSVIESGAVYKCYLNKKDCIEWIIDGAKENRIFRHNMSIIQVKNNSWLGATVFVEDSPVPRVAVCAPNWKQFLTDKQGNNGWYMNGMCYFVIANDSSMDGYSSKHYFPLSSIKNQIFKIDNVIRYYYGMGQAGFSAHIAPDSYGLVLGAPGVAYWTGTTMMIQDNDTFIAQVLTDSHFKIFNYFGYSITSGKFYDKNERFYASGAPRADIFGKVFIFAFPKLKKDLLTIRQIIESEQYGEYFGSSLTSCDINNDGRDDLIVGAPLWSKDIDEGRAYVYVSKEQSLFATQRINGNYPFGRFGTSISCLGDLDQDGFSDIAIGAPYESNGAVYIYNGNARGALGQPSQRITALELSPTLRGFGISISEPARDINSDGCIDLAVGAYDSSQVVLLTSKAVVHLKLELSCLNTTLNIMDAVNSTHFTIYICAIYDGLKAPDTFKVMLILKFDEFHQRALIYENGKIFEKIYKMFDTLKKGQLKCTLVKIILKKNIQNFIDPIKIEASLHNDEDPSCSTCPIINPISKTVDNLKLDYVLDCGTDNVCVSDLQLSITSSLDFSNNSYIIGSKSNVKMTIYVNNTKEPAYRAEMKIFIPEPITLVRVPLECEKEVESQVNERLEIVCNLGNPLRYNNIVALEFDMNSIQYNDTIKYSYHEINVTVTTRSKEEDTSNNTKVFKINYIINADLSIAGKSEKDHYSYLESEIIEKSSKNFTFHHIYEVEKIGFTPIEEAVLLVNFPVRFRNVEIARLNRSSMNNQKYNCEIDETPSLLLGERNNYELSKETIHSNLTSMEKQVFTLSCTHSNVTCQKLRCNMGPFVETTSKLMSKLIITIDFQISNFTAETIAEKDIIYVSQAYVKIIEPDIKIKNFKQILTFFVSRRNPESVSIWTIFLSVLLGIVILVIISLLLFKLGFFERRRIDDLQTTRLMDKENPKNINESMD